MAKPFRRRTPLRLCIAEQSARVKSFSVAHGAGHVGGRRQPPLLRARVRHVADHRGAERQGLRRGHRRDELHRLARREGRESRRPVPDTEKRGREAHGRRGREEGVRAGVHHAAAGAHAGDVGVKKHLRKS